METNGIKVDDIYLRKLSKKFEQQIEKIEKKYTQLRKRTLILDHQNNLVKLYIMT